MICGGIDDTAALQAAINTGYALVERSNCMAGNLTLAVDHTTIIGQGAGSVITLKAGSTGALIATGMHDLLISDIRLSGGSIPDQTAATTSTADRDGLFVNSQANTTVRNVTFDNFENRGLMGNACDSVGTYCWTPSTVISSEQGPHLLVTGSRAINNYVGFDTRAGWGAEYIGFSNDQYSGNNTALMIRAGNVNVSGEIIGYNKEGIALSDAYGNGGHGTVTGSMINHVIDCAICVTGISIGENFTGNQINLGAVCLVNSTGISISDGMMNSVALQFGGGGKNYVQNNFFYSTPAITHSYGGSPDASCLRENYTSSGAYPDGCGP